MLNSADQEANRGIETSVPMVIGNRLFLAWPRRRSLVEQALCSMMLSETPTGLVAYFRVPVHLAVDPWVVSTSHCIWKM